MVTRKLGPALAAGCTAVLRPARATPLIAIAIYKILEEVGIPKGVVNLITGTDSAGMGDELATNPKVRKLTFTGSTEVGKQLIAKCATTVKRVSMELGGHAPFIVFDDADMDKAADAVVLSRFRNAGQTCICTNRVYVQKSIAGAFAEKVASRVSALKVGNGLEAGIQVGPLIDEHGFRKVEEHVRDAVARGGTVLAGGKPFSTPTNGHANGHANGNGNGHLHGWFFEPTVIGNAHPEMLVMHEETFGPVLPIMEFETEEEAISMANDTPTASLRTSSRAMSGASSGLPRVLNTASSAQTIHCQPVPTSPSVVSRSQASPARTDPTASTTSSKSRPSRSASRFRASGDVYASVIDVIGARTFGPAAHRSCGVSWPPHSPDLECQRHAPQVSPPCAGVFRRRDGCHRR